MNAAEYALSLANAAFSDIAVDIDGTSWSMIDAAGDFAGLATWEQLEESAMFAGEEGWIEGPHGLNVYADGNVARMLIALEAFRSS